MKLKLFIALWILATAYPAFVQLNEWRNEALDNFAQSRMKVVQERLRMNDVSQPDSEKAPVGGARP